MRAVRLACLAVVLAAAANGPRAGAAGSVTTCDAANPFDTEPDDVALQACLDDFDTVLLKPSALPGYVGYRIASTIKIKRRGTLLTTSDNPHMATIVAAPALDSSMLRALGVDEFEISFIRFDGNRAVRVVRDKPCDDLHNYRNVEIQGNGFRVRYIESIGAVCGSALTVGDSSEFEIARSRFYDNGRQPEEANGIAGLWADGLTVFKCVQATIRDNQFWDNTDVDLGVNGGAGCAVYRNTIAHFARYAFAGLVIGDPSRSGGEFSHNLISSGPDLLGFGILVGCHPWNQCNGGFASGVSVHDNRATGAVVNLAIDGLNGGSVQNNVMSGARGTRVMNCPGRAADYTAGHTVNVSLQAGFVVRTFDAAGPCVQ